MQTIDLYKLTKEVKPLIEITWVTPEVTSISGARPIGSKVKIALPRTTNLEDGQDIYIYNTPDGKLKGFHKILHVEDKGMSLVIEADLKEGFRTGSIATPKTYEVFQKDDLPVQSFARYNQAQAEMMQTLELISPKRARATLNKTIGSAMDQDGSEIADTASEVSKEIVDNIATSDTITWADLAKYATSQLELSCQMLEALAQMPEGLLVGSQVPASVVGNVYQLVQAAVDEAEAVDEEGDTPDPKAEVEEVKPKTPRKRTKKQTDIESTTNNT